MRRKTYVFLFIVFALFVIIKSGLNIGNSKVVYGSENINRSSGWNSIISKDINTKNISVVVDGQDVRIDDGDIYFDSNMNLMISLDRLTDIYQCATNFYDGRNVVIEKYTTRIEASTGAPEVKVNSNTVKLTTPVIYKNGTVYVPADLVETGLSYTSSWDVHTGTVTFTNQKPDEKVLPYKYDYRNNGRLSVVKNQDNLGTCWAFAALTALETAMLPEEVYDFSEDHMTLNNSYSATQLEGGDYTMSMAYLAAWQGPVLEKDDPYGDGYSPKGLDAVVHVQEIQIIESKNFENIKRAVFMHGGVQSSLYMSLANATDSASIYYNYDNYSYCYMGTEKPNHDIVIIGWDDTYPASNFTTQPEGDGAFICVNSWGNDFGDNGVFYVSYYDSNIGVHNLVYTGIESKDNYDNIYQSDLCGWVGQLGYDDKDSAYFSNVYTAGRGEALKAVSFYATGMDTEYEIYLVNNFKDTSSFSQKKLLQSGTFNNAGYYTIDLDDEVKLQDYEKFAIVVYIYTPNSVHPIAIEYPADSATSTVDISDGEGYISLKGNSWEHVEETQNCNICLKVFTDRIK